jgi:Ca2+/Na+ antiporter
MLGLELSFQKPPFLLVFLVYTLLVGSFYGMVWSVVMAVKHRKPFYAELKRSLAKPPTRRLRMALLGFGAAMIIWSLFVHDYFLKMLILSLFMFVFLFFYLWVFVKAVEKVCMLKRVQPEQLTEGDWIAKDVFVGGKYITGPKDLGVEKKSIAKLIALKKKGKVRKILIKVGIPFVPSFLIAFVLAVLFSNAFASLWVLFS